MQVGKSIACEQSWLIRDWPDTAEEIQVSEPRLYAFQCCCEQLDGEERQEYGVQVVKATRPTREPSSPTHPGSSENKEL